MVRRAMPTAPRANPAETLRKLTELHERGVITDDELKRLRARLRV
jgi:Short C-terminal domain